MCVCVCVCVCVWGVCVRVCVVCHLVLFDLGLHGQHIGLRICRAQPHAEEALIAAPVDAMARLPCERCAVHRSTCMSEREREREERREKREGQGEEEDIYIYINIHI